MDVSDETRTMSLGLDHLQEMYGAVIDSFLDVVDEGTWKHRERILDTA